MIDSAEEIVSAVRESAGLIMEPDNRNALNKVEQQIIDVQEAVLTLHKAKQLHSVSATDYVTQIQEYSQRMKELEAQQTHLRSTQDRYTEVKVWLDAFAEHIKSGDIINTDDGLIIKTFVEHIIVNKDSIEIRFKCGVVMEKELA